MTRTAKIPRFQETNNTPSTLSPRFCKLDILQTEAAMKTTSVEEFYIDIATSLRAKISKEIGHFNVFRYEDVIAGLKIRPVMPYIGGFIIKLVCLGRV